MYCLEHGVRPDGYSDEDDLQCDTIFNQLNYGKFIPRAVFIDLEPTPIGESIFI